MTRKDGPASPAAGPRPRVTLERVYRADVQDVWDLWTTSDGIESWWGPGGFKVTVHKLDLRAGGELLYAMTAIDPPQVAFMTKAGMPLTQELRITFTEVQPRKRLAYVHLADFIPGVEPYDVATVVELHETADGVRMVLTFDAMHSDEWTERATMGWESELGKLAARLDSAPRGPVVTRAGRRVTSRPQHPGRARRLPRHRRPVAWHRRGDARDRRVPRMGPGDVRWPLRHGPAPTAWCSRSSVDTSPRGWRHRQ